MRKFLIGALTALLLTVGIGGCLPVLAEGEDEAAAEDVNSLRVSPSGTRLELTPGAVLEGTEPGCISSLSDSCSVQVQNPGSRAFRYKVYFTPYSVTGPDNELSFSHEGDAVHTQIARWVKVKNADGEYVDEAIFTIGPGETQTVEYQVTIPDDIPGGSQYAVLWAQIMNEDEGAGGIQTLGQVGSVITGRSSSESREEADIRDLDMTRFTFGGALKASAKVNNTGNTDFEIKATYTARTFFGKEIHSDEKTVAAYPDIDYDVEMEWNETPMLGIFNVEFKVTAAESEVTETHIVVIMPIFVMILLILLLTIIIVWIIILVRKRKERKARKLV